MKLGKLAWSIAILSLNSFAQENALTNVDFEGGTAGVSPFGWQFGYNQPKLSYYAQTVAKGCNGGKQCAIVRSTVPHEAYKKALLFQIVPAQLHRNQKFTFRAAVRAEVTGANASRLLVRIHRDDGSSCFLENMTERPIVSAQWTYYETTGDVCAEAHDLEVGMQLWGDGTAWMDDASLVFVGHSVP